MKKIAVTGATSMIGIALIEECVKKNIEVLAIVRKKTKNINRLPVSKNIQSHRIQCHRQYGSEVGKHRVHRVETSRI